jgi:hypothetical protein
MLEVAGAAIAAEREATREIYARIAHGGADACNCQACRNYRMVREYAYPAEFLHLLDELGIDHRKELEVYFGVPVQGGLHHYQGWFCFVGKAYGRSATSPAHNAAFTYRIDDSGREPPAEFDGQRVVHLWFATSVPWKLPEPWSLLLSEFR